MRLVTYLCGLFITYSTLRIHTFKVKPVQSHFHTRSRHTYILSHHRKIFQNWWHSGKKGREKESVWQHCNHKVFRPVKRKVRNICCKWLLVHYSLFSAAVIKVSIFCSVVLPLKKTSFSFQLALRVMFCVRLA